MNLIKGFVSIAPYINNNPNQIAPLGELSTWSSTYSKDKGEYQDNNIPGFKLTTFKSVDTESGVIFQLSTGQVTQILSLVQKAISYATNHIRPYDPVDFRNTLQAGMFSELSDLNFGDMVDNGVLALPEWFTWNSLKENKPFVKIWLSDLAFQNQYDDYEIVVIPPIEPLDMLFGSYGTAVDQLTQMTMPVLTEKIQQAKGLNPETFLRTLSFNYYNRLNLQQTTVTNWPVLIYGKAGDNVDAIKDAIVNYILQNSTYTRTQWEQILPDLFKRTEFVFLPRWDKMAIPNLVEKAGIYSSILNLKECIQFAQTNISFYTPSWIDQNALVLPYDYKALMLICINGNNNVPGKEQLTNLFADYIPVPSTDYDFNRMQVKTREWVLLMEQLIMVAETATEYTTVPSNLRRIKRDGILFMSALFDNVNYLMAVKSNTFYQ